MKFNNYCSGFCCFCLHILLDIFKLCKLVNFLTGISIKIILICVNSSKLLCKEIIIENICCSPFCPENSRINTLWHFHQSLPLSLHVICFHGLSQITVAINDSCCCHICQSLDLHVAVQ